MKTTSASQQEQYNALAVRQRWMLDCAGEARIGTAAY
jgi:hypothetical protein